MQIMRVEEQALTVRQCAKCNTVVNPGHSERSLTCLKIGTCVKCHPVSSGSHCHSFQMLPCDSSWVPCCPQQCSHQTAEETHPYAGEWSPALSSHRWPPSLPALEAMHEPKLLGFQDFPNTAERRKLGTAQDTHKRQLLML